MKSEVSAPQLFYEKGILVKIYLRFIVFLQNKGIAPKTINAYIAGVTQWLAWNNAVIENYQF